MSSKSFQNRSFRLALLIDGDNAQPSLIEAVLEEAAKKGAITIRRIYGDWTKPDMNGWKKVLNANAIQPKQQFQYTRGKNSTDSALIIDAMDILHGKLVDGFCIVSSDSDYTRLATRIREEGVFVMGIGEKKTPAPFVKACEQFIYTENLDSESNASSPAKTRSPKTQAARKENQRKLVKLLKKAYELAEEESESAYLGKIGETLRQLDPGFDPRTYGSRTMTQLFRSLPDHFEIVSADKGSSVYIRLKTGE